MARFSPEFLDELRLRLKASDVIGRSVKLRREGREFRGLSPFTTEKTPSFFVNDEKARYFDFSSGKSGDIVSFLMDTQSLSFAEAVTQLADLAGLEIPKDTPEEAARAAKAKGLAEVMVEAARYYRSLLTRSDGREASTYLDGRRVPERARKIFGVGYAPASRHALKDYLLNKDYPLSIQIEAGLLIAPEDGTTPYDRFRHRVMFPILGSRGRVIAFGGRALEKDAKAKYLNSPETALFHKSHTLYNLDRARRVAHKSGKPIIVAEGYLDVIAIDGAGWPAVAPLGTALTEQQLSLLWQSQDTPILCFDGDRAGKSAAYRAIDRALPLLKPGKSLAFVFLGDGLDPDDLIRQRGPTVFADLVGTARPLAEIVWDRHLETQPRDTPEQQAAFRQSLRSLVGTIAHADVRRAYGGYLGEKLSAFDGGMMLDAVPIAPAPPPFFEPTAQPARSAARGGAGYRPGGRGGYPPPLSASPALKARLATPKAPSSTVDSVREAVIVVTLLHHPQLFSRHEDTVLSVEIGDKRLTTLLSSAIDALTADPDLDSAALRSHMLENSVSGQTYAYWAAHPMVRLARFARADATIEDAERGWLNALSIDRHQGDLKSEVAEAAAEAHLDPGRERTWFDAVSHRANLMAQHRSADGDDIT